MSNFLADVLSDKALPDPDTVKDETPEPETPDPVDLPADEPKDPIETPPPEEDKPSENAQVREPNGKFAKTVPLEALHAEREKRRQLEAQIAESEKKPRPSVFEDEDKAFNERLSQATQPLVQKLFNLSVSAAKRVPGREDYQDIYDFMNSEVQAHPELMRDIDASEDPGEYIYQLGKTRKELSEVGGDITKLRDHITTKARAELKLSKDRIKALEAELAAMKASQEKRAKIPQSLNAEASGAVKDDVFAGPTPLKTILGK